MADGSAQITTEVTQIEDALDALVSCCIDHAVTHRRKTNRGLVPAGEMVVAALDRVRMTKAARRASDLFEDPIGSALKLGVRRLGERLFEIGGLAQMEDSLYRVAERDPGTSTSRISLMDHRWDGIGTTATRAGWCA